MTEDTSLPVVAYEVPSTGGEWTLTYAAWFRNREVTPGSIPLANHTDAEARITELQRENEALKLQAQIWKQEARTQQATVHEAYQVAKGATGEPGDWNGAEPVRARIAELQQQLAKAECEVSNMAKLREAAARCAEASEERCKALESECQSLSSLIQQMDAAMKDKPHDR